MKGATLKLTSLLLSVFLLSHIAVAQSPEDLEGANSVTPNADGYGFHVDLSGDFLFDFDDDRLTVRAMKSLSRVLDLYKKHQGFEIVIPVTPIPKGQNLTTKTCPYAEPMLFKPGFSRTVFFQRTYELKPSGRPNQSPRICWMESIIQKGALSVDASNSSPKRESKSKCFPKRKHLEQYPQDLRSPNEFEFQGQRDHPPLSLLVTTNTVK